MDKEIKQERKVSSFWLWLIVVLAVVSIISFSHFAFTIGEVWGYVHGYQDAHNYILYNLTNN